ncbi:MAG: hypothetical protein IJL17_02080 [Kiritimatiellae bacterium]|nr:hypothetical protein [Kiritimatiellia bacterium]
MTDPDLGPVKGDVTAECVLTALSAGRVGARQGQACSARRGLDPDDSKTLLDKQTKKENNNE